MTELDTRNASDTPYRPDIDGLRAIAVAAVILYHAFPTAVTGGFIGVDVFFVISGFLISGNVFRRIEAGQFSFLDFYSRRIRRIFPALLVILLASLAYGFVVLLPTELALLGKDVAGGAGFASNLLLWHEAGYFDRAAVTKPLLHLWSLGVEEQFYIVWPIAIWLLYRKRRTRPTFLVIAWAISLLVSLVIVGSHPTNDFYSPITRLWELASGAILAWMDLQPRPPLIVAWHSRAGDRSWIADVASLLGLALILGTAVLINRNLPFPGWLALLPVSGALMLIATGPTALVNRSVLTHRLAIFIGLISYPLYLWHWPLISFGYVIDHEQPLKAFLALCLIVLSVLLGWLTYRFVEQPVRFGRNRSGNTIVLATLMAAMGFAGMITWWEK